MLLLTVREKTEADYPTEPNSLTSERKKEKVG